MTLSKQLRKLMDNVGIGNKELHEKSGLSLRTVNNLLSGEITNPTLSTMREIAKALNCTLDDLDNFAEEQKKREA